MRAGRSRAGARAGPRCGVPASLVFSGNGSPGSRVWNAILPSRPNEGAICSAAPAATRRGLPPAGSIVQMSKLPPASGLAAYASRGPSPRQAGIDTTCVAVRQPAQAAAVAADDVEARRALAAVLADEGDPAAVGRPVRLGVGPRRRGDRALADIEVAVARGDDGCGRPRRRFRVPVPGGGGEQRQWRERRCDQEKSELRPPCRRMLPDRSGRQAGSGRRTPRRPRRAWRPGPRRHPRRRRAATTRRACRVGEARRELGGELLLSVGHEVQLRQLRAADHLAEAEEELGLERADREQAAVGGLVDPVAGEAAGEEARQRVAAEPVRDEPVRAVRHRDRQPRATAGALPLEQGGEHLDDRAERARGEVRGLDRRQPRRRVLEHAGPAEVVQVVSRARRVRPVGAEAGDRAVDDRIGHVVRADSEPGGDSGTEALEHDVRAPQQGARELWIGLEVAGDRFLAPVQRLVPRGRHVPHRVALGRLEPDDARAQSQQLAGGERTREVAGQVDDEHVRERLHRRRTYH